ncbi:MAG: hypothetical protein KKG84_02575 [Candidatus Omnitrophica bacterium]|nr:hypothetical protein [Candidatus Omnitrophota bacterium]
MKIIAGILLGGGIGFLVGYFGKCASGTCPLTSDPVISSLIGASMGVMIALLK